MPVGCMEARGIHTTPPAELHEYLMAAAKIVETISFEMAQHHSVNEVLQLLGVARDIETQAQELKTQF